MHLVHSSMSLHWLSQVPSGLHGDDVSLNKRNIYLTKTSPSIVIESYKQQHHNDFTLFLESRAQEVVTGGRMVLAMVGREETHPTEESYFWHPMEEALDDMASEKLIEEEELEKFNVPFYAPSLDEIKAAVQKEGSFNLEQEYVYKFSWDRCQDTENNDNIAIGRNVAESLRVVTESMFLKNFTNMDMDELIRRFAEKVATTPHEKRIDVHIFVELKKRNS